MAHAHAHAHTKASFVAVTKGKAADITPWLSDLRGLPWYLRNFGRAKKQEAKK